MKRSILVLVLVLAIGMVLCACSIKKEDKLTVREELQERFLEIESYKTKGVLEFRAGGSNLVYDVEVWYQKPDLYRVSFTNDDVDRNQIILKNKDGVHILTPSLNKNMQFQSEWPNNSGQVYLYQSLLKDIIDDKKGKLVSNKTQHIFTTMTNYVPNPTLKSQEITMNKKTLAIEKVEIYDKENNVSIKMNFNKTEFNPKFSKNDFNIEKNMARARVNNYGAMETYGSLFFTKYPKIFVDDIVLVSESKIGVEGQESYQLTFKGEDRGFVLFQKQVSGEKNLSTVFQIGEPLDIGFTVAVVTDTSLSWKSGNIEYLLSSKDLTKDEMVMIAHSLQ